MLVDTNVLVDVLENDPDWADWSIAQLQIGPQIDPGVPWCHSTCAAGGLHIALKSGNFGTEDFFTKAFGALK
jgi:uncharacterized protein YgbK (DUF1537 family)